MDRCHCSLRKYLFFITLSPFSFTLAIADVINIYLNHPSVRLSVDSYLFSMTCHVFLFLFIYLFSFLVTQDVEAAQQLVWDSKNLNYQLALTLPYANVDYNVTIWARSTVANKSDDRFWSPAASTIFRTLPDRELLVKR